jgi:hypothetical protein
MNTQPNNPQKTNQFNLGRVTQIIVGLAMLSMGVIFLLNETGLIDPPANWWAIYLLFPVAGFLTAGYYMYVNNGRRLSVEVLILGLLALIMAVLSVSLLLGLYLPIDWGAIWPLVIIVIGLSMLFATRR